MGVSARNALQCHGTGRLRQHRGSFQPNGQIGSGLPRPDLGRLGGRGCRRPITMSWLTHSSPAQQFVLFSAAKIIGVFAVMMTIVAYAVYVERRVAAFIQDRLGPNRVGPFGLLQPLADAGKAFLKEDFTPAYVRKAYYWLAPAIVMIPSLLTIAIIPFGSKLGEQRMVIADLNV